MTRMTIGLIESDKEAPAEHARDVEHGEPLKIHERIYASVIVPRVMILAK